MAISESEIFTNLPNFACIGQSLGIR